MIAQPRRLVLLGHPVSHSLSPTFQNAALRSAGLPLVYETLDVSPATFADTLRGLASQGAAGNVTVPHKERAAAAVDRLTTLAERVGAVNTFWVDGNSLVGDNTDVGGFDAAARALLDKSPANLRIALLGAGGAGAAAIAAAERWPGSYVRVWSRTAERAAALAARWPEIAHAVEFLSDAIRDADLVVNATPIGLHSDDIPVPPALLRKRAAVIDLVYRRGETPWIQLCRKRGMRAIDGLPMLIEQGALAFERWFGRTADREAMWTSVR